MNYQYVLTELNLNMMPCLHMSRILLPLIRQRQHGGALINVASGLCETPVLGTVLYNAANAFIVNLTQSLREELDPSVDVLCVTPHLTDTNLKILKHYDAFLATPKECVAGSLNELGRANVTAGA
eukprot:CAMPEP_0201281224 /NCGR_PEP_ID=MMETSP1317-20130820/1987_1 /ASSEMBLY_ACC=CAM_ASM_000770 /TAXON_ID=187299 /ORGANISM="Undescribed Undescribed, Strain Undescribed" /LENGTH=124 /DNA_ID=CAMNT_0047590535 /DNA_START=387 /DNA_END=761 /DNA_ORIENTATION=+